MILHVEFDDDGPGGERLTVIQDRMTEVEAEQKLVIRIQSQALFDAMHSV